MDLVNDNYCNWINNLDRRSNIKSLNKDKSCDWLIIGAGYTGLSALENYQNFTQIKKLLLLTPN